MPLLLTSPYPYYYLPHIDICQCRSFSLLLLQADFHPLWGFVKTFWLKGNKLPSFVQFTAGAGSPLTVQLNVTLDPICALWLTGALIIVGFRPSIKGNKDVFLYHRLFSHFWKQRHQLEARVDKIQWFVWNRPPPASSSFLYVCSLERKAGKVY